MKKYLKIITKLTLTATLVLGMFSCTNFTEPHEHTFGEWTVTVEATEEAEGKKEKECLVCHLKETDKIAKLEHIHKFAANYTSDAIYHWYAAICIHTTEVKDKAEHTFGEWTVKTAATCNAEGIKERECTACKYKETAVIEKLPHTYSTTWSTDAAKHWHSATCEHQNQVKDMEEHIFGEWTVITQPTEKAEGLKERSCSVCSYKVTAPVAKLDHKHTFATAYTSNNIYHWHAATCEHTAEEGDKEEHSYDEWIVKNAATCSADGLIERECIFCKYKVSAVIEKLPHKYATTWSTDKNNHWHAATCGHTTEISDKNEHTFGEWKVKTPVSCGADGLNERECTVCKYTETAVIEKLPHTYATDWTNDETHHWHAATCDHKSEVSNKAEHTWEKGEVTKKVVCGITDGEITYTCSVCKATKKETVIKKEAHTWDNGIITVPVKKYTCKDCGETKSQNIKEMSVSAFINEITNVKYITSEEKDEPGITKSADGETVNVWGIVLTGTTATKLNFPSTLITCNLTGIDTRNFIGMSDMFRGCINLTSLDLSTFDTSYVRNMSYMFFGCESLTSLDLSNFDTKSVTDMREMFDGCKSLTSLDLSKFDTGNVTDMGCMFYKCKGLESLDLSSFDTSKVTNTSSIFIYTDKLTTVKYNSSTFSSVIVNDYSNKTWIDVAKK